MASLQELIDKNKAEVEAYIISKAEELENYRIEFLGTKGRIKDVMGAMKDVPSDMKREAGLLLNELKQKAEAKYEAFKIKFEEKTTKKSDSVLDETLPGADAQIGARHPLSLTMNRMIAVFEKIGFTVAEGPEIEDDWHNFNALNLPDNHPARDMQDTFYINTKAQHGADWMLRTHTSSVQVRVMEEGKLPIRQVFPGRVYRNETISARAHCFFHQVEGLYIDEGVSFADLKQTLYYFVQQLFGKDVKVRFRPSYFPFTEPSAEMDVSCFICEAKGCSVCKQTGWVEILGCGMVHPNVLDNCKIDSKKYTGFAWGMGVERMAMMLYNIKDIRLLSENDIRFLEQFK
jgi:phenylalanyl-tRNA synthetase alpha chain